MWTSSADGPRGTREGSATNAPFVVASTIIIAVIAGIALSASVVFSA